MLLMLSLMLVSPAPLPGQDPAQPMLVSVDWLAARLGEPNLVLLQIGDDNSKNVYDEGHIAGSQFVHPWNEFAAPRGPDVLSLELPTIEKLTASLRAKGISNDSRVVLVSANEYLTPTSRTFLTLAYAGLEGRVSILDGGLEAWKAAGHPVTPEVPTVRMGSYSPSVNERLVVSANFVASRLGDARTKLVDARLQRFYQGAETRQGRNGHLPGAVSVPFSSLFQEDGRYKSLNDLRMMFSEAGIAPGAKVITYCHIGQQATAVWFVAKLLGYDASLYDGSFQEWAKLTDLPVVTPTPGDEPSTR